jgi:uncharacterized protein (DUF2235 family)
MGKNIVICCDGTNAEYREDNTNVVKTFEALEKDAGQVAFYDPGVGTFSIFGRTVGKWIGTLLGMGFGYGIRTNIEDAYEYLMNTYEPEDRVFIFGFSRGAYTARALAGMICRFGILHANRKNLIPYVTKMNFKGLKVLKKKEKVITGFSDSFCNKCIPHFIGVWDTVGALGPNLSKKFHNDVLNKNIRYGYHALSVDERRWTYKARCWDENDYDPEQQTIEQVWFPGGHSDVGGGCRNDERELSDIAFAWMMDKAGAQGLRLKPDWQAELRQNAGGKMHNGWTVWLMYIIKTIRRIPDGARVFWPLYILNPDMLKARLSPSKGKTGLAVNPLVHKSVIDRMADDKNYRPVIPEKQKGEPSVTASYPDR